MIPEVQGEHQEVPWKHEVGAQLGEVPGSSKTVPRGPQPNATVMGGAHYCVPGA
jgi:hypothetical protein